MDKETLLSKFKPSMGEPNATSQSYENIGISVRTLDAYVDRILPSITDDASVTDDFIKGHVEFLKAVGGQMRHEFAEFAKNYKPTTQTTPPPTTSENEELKSLKELVVELQNQMKGEQAKKSAAELRNSVLGKSKELKVKNQALWNDVVNSIDISEGMDSSSLETKVKSAYEAKLKAYFGDGAQPYGGEKGGSGTSGEEEAAKTRREAFKKRMQSQGRLPKSE